IHLEHVAEALANANRSATIKRLRRTSCVCNREENVVWSLEWRRATVRRATPTVHIAVRRENQVRTRPAHVGIHEPRQMKAFGNGQVNVSDPTGTDFLLVTHVVGINARVGIVFAENRNSRELRKRTWRQRCGSNDLGIRWEEKVSGNEAAINFLLLHAIGC